MSSKGQTENFGFRQRDPLFWVSFSSKTRKMILEHFLNGPNRTNFEYRKHAEITGKSVKNGRFGPSKRQNSGIYQDIYLKFCTRIQLTGLFHMYSGFLKIRKFSLIFFGFFFVNYFFYNFQNFQNFENLR